jgi:hypothetical protein
MRDYETQATNFLTKHGITFSALFKGDKCPMWDDDKHIHGDRYLVVFQRGELGVNHQRFSLSFWNSLNDKEKGTTPTAYDVLAAITKYDPEDFESFCSNFGYDTDSRKALKTYNAVVKEWRDLSGFFTSEELEELAEIN